MVGCLMIGLNFMTPLISFPKILILFQVLSWFKPGWSRSWVLIQEHFLFWCPLRLCRAVDLRCQILIQRPLKQGGSTPISHKGLSTSATVNPKLLSLGTAVSTSFPASADLPRFEIQVTIVTFISSNRFPVWISIVCSFLFFSSTLFLIIF